MTPQKNGREGIKKKVRDEVADLFHYLYSGVHLPTISEAKVDYFVTKALNIYDREVFYDEKKKRE